MARFTIKYKRGITDWISIGDLRAQIQKSLGYGLPLILVGNIAAKTQLALLKFAEDLRVDVALHTSHRVSRELESRAQSLTGKCDNRLDPSLVGLASLDGRAAQELTWLLRENDLSSNGRRYDMEETGHQDLDEYMADT